MINVTTTSSTSSVETVTKSPLAVTQFSMKGGGQTITEPPAIKTTTSVKTLHQLNTLENTMLLGHSWCGKKVSPNS